MSAAVTTAEANKSLTTMPLGSHPIRLSYPTKVVRSDLRREPGYDRVRIMSNSLSIGMPLSLSRLFNRVRGLGRLAPAAASKRPL